MPIGLLFWIVYLVALIFGAYGAFTPAWPGGRFGGLVAIILVGLLGWAVFGFAVHR